MGIEDVIRRFGSAECHIGDYVEFLLFFAERLRGPLGLMNGELEGRGDARRLGADFRVREGADGSLSGVEVALVMSDGTEFAREYCFDADGVYADDKAHAVMCLCGDAARLFGLKDQYGKVRVYPIGGRKRGFSAEEEADFAARLDEGFVPDAGPRAGDGEPADTELRYVEVPKDEPLYRLTEEIAKVAGDGAKMCEHRLREKTGMEINFEVKVSGHKISVIVVKGHGIVTPLVWMDFTTQVGDEKVKSAEGILRRVEDRFLSEYNRWKSFFNVKDYLEEIGKERVCRGLEECCEVLQEELVPHVNKYSRELEAGKSGALRLVVRVTQHGKWPQRDGDVVEDVVNLLLYEKAATKKGKESMIWSTWFGEDVLKEKKDGIVEYLKGRIDAVIFERYGTSKIG